MKRKGSTWILLGLLLIAAALVLTAWNLLESKSAGDASQKILAQMEEKLTAISTTVQQQSDLTTVETENLQPDVCNPDMEMPVVTVNGKDYIGVLRIPVLELELPVISQWSYPDLKTAPCRYRGSAYRNDLIILAHNYGSHFGGLKNLHFGDSVTFTDADGNVFSYTVVEMEELQPSAVAQMENGEWDLTLFTCTTGGQSRFTVRCILENG